MIYVGEIAGLVTAALWAGTSLAFALASRRAGALAVNQARTVMAIVMLALLHRVLLGSFWPTDLGGRQATWLALSGLVGLSLGDLFYFHSLAQVGPRLGSLLLSTWPVFCALLAWPVLGEGLGAGAVAGIAVTLGGVLLVLADRSRAARWVAPAGGSRARGLVAGCLGAAGQAVGLVIAKLGMEPVSGLEAGMVRVDPLSATLVRMVAGAAGIWLIAAAGGRLASGRRVIVDRRALAGTVVGALLGPTFGVWMSLVAAAHAPTGIAATLMATTPIVTLPLARLAYGSRPGGWAIAGTVLAAAGVALLFLLPAAPTI
ncbi:MAG: DMT family transporter [Candidatus Eiseniibacteriota bacterium]|jgi:drug/metabolite transporter (DMT)-like permease